MNSCVAWLFYSRYKLLNMSVQKRNYKQGYMLSSGGLSEEVKDGFSVVLWLKWRESFKELTVGGTRMIQSEAVKGCRLIIVCGYQMGYDVPGGQEYLDRTKTHLEIVTQESGRESVYLADIKHKTN
ncbi:hypothetical protein BJ875DRAFT_542215 [Amylocarpus encephaloides]|uniref:Uncharacterized protein n=1 Tax=Amylocarpus encephaloides TaxID=45428 RepID=A0A9P7YKS1_9HELO|nr:hypothetical protein BJ875DRAFT_542215 [Amylocarpus encephaloides]